MRFKTLLACLTVTALAACGSDKLVGRPDLRIVQGDVLPPPSSSDTQASSREYRIGPLDKLDIDVVGLPDFTRSVLVDANGDIAYPLAGSVKASGRTPRELSQAIATALRARFVRDPQVTVNPTNVSQVLAVDGEVREPGLYPVLGNMTLVRAIASAKGTTEFANTNYVVVFRTVAGRQMAALYDLRAIRQGIYADPSVYPNDVITVGESGGRRTFQTIIQGSGLIVTPIVALLN